MVGGMTIDSVKTAGFQSESTRRRTSGTGRDVPNRRKWESSPDVLPGFYPYLAELEELIAASSANTAQLAVHLDGEAGRRLRTVVPLDELRRLGAFFTGESLARTVVDHVPQRRARYIDPACGCGDLLLAASARLPVRASLEETLASWNERLTGRDLMPEFVRAARARLALAALARGVQPAGDVERPADLLTNISVGDGLTLNPRRGDGVLLNPPYGSVIAPTDCKWSAGMTTDAALFVDRVLDQCEPGASIAAVLPEVLRGGSRYGRFRAVVNARLANRTVQSAGLFDALTDVHVFLLAGQVRERRIDAGRVAEWVPAAAGDRLEDVCSVSVGSVVANRDPQTGPAQLYLDARSRGTGREVRPVARRRFDKRAVTPPFVVVARTSRPEERERAGLRATIVRGDAPVAVENHLLVLVPHDHTLRGCRRVAGLVESRDAAEFLNDRLRCRHLTVQALRDIPR
jgi:hypothetical protein